MDTLVSEGSRKMTLKCCQPALSLPGVFRLQTENEAPTEVRLKAQTNAVNTAIYRQAGLLSWR